MLSPPVSILYVLNMAQDSCFHVCFAYVVGSSCCCPDLNLLYQQAIIYLNSLFSYRLDLFHAVDGMCKDSGVSKMARSLFASLPHRPTKNVALFQQQTGDVFMEKGHDLLEPGSIQGPFHEFHDVFSSQFHKKANIGVHISLE